MIKNFLFDFDGTVANTIPGILITLDKTRYAMNCFYDVDYAKTLIGLPLVTMGEKLCGADRATEFLDTYRSEYIKWGADKISFFPGVEELLKQLKDAGLSCAVVTSKRRDSLLGNLDFLQAHDYFDVLITKESVDFFKPHPAAAEKALTDLNAEPAESVLIGDTHYDILCGKGAFLKTVAVTWGTEPEAELIQSKPDYLIHTGSELKDLCMKLAGI